MGRLFALSRMQGRKLSLLDGAAANLAEKHNLFSVSMQTEVHLMCKGVSSSVHCGNSDKGRSKKPTGCSPLCGPGPESFMHAACVRG